MHRIPGSKSYKTTFWAMFSTCLHYIFKLEIFSTKVFLNKKKLRQLNMTPANNYVPKNDSYSTRECKTEGVKNISFPTS